MSLTRSLIAAFAATIATAVAPAHAQTRTIEVAYVPFVGVAQLFVIDEEKWDKEQGLELKLTRFSSGSALVQGLASGKFDAVYVALSPVVVARAGGVDLKVVAANTIENTALLGLGTLVKAYEKNPKPAEAFAAFQREHGRPVKIASLPKGSTPDTTLRYYLETHAIPASQVEVLSMGEEQIRQALLAKAVDAAVVPEPILTILTQRDPASRVLATGKQLMPDHPGFVLAVRESLIKSSPQTVAKLVALNARATKLIVDDPARAAKATSAGLGKGLIDEQVLARALASPHNIVSDDPNRIIASTDVLQDFQVKIGAQPRKIPVGELYDLSFFNALKAGRQP